MKAVWLVSSVVVALSCCKPRDVGTVVRADEEPPGAKASEELLEYFPLIPIIERTLWADLLEAEGRLANASGSGRDVVRKEVADLSDKLRARHPFKAEDGRLELGGIGYDKATGRFTLAAQVEYPDPGDERHPGEVELLLCTEGGRVHETLFVCKARPLHLELLLHLSGHVKSARASRFRIEVMTQEGERIPVDSLVRADGGVLEVPLLWEFSGSDYEDVYSPDLSGDFAIFWHAHDAVLRVVDGGIASGEVKLTPVPHPKLRNGDPVVLELVPVGSR